jgi:DNA-binding NarL/FixJ family response regulator
MSDRVYRLLLVDLDPIFRLGLRVALNAFPDIQIVAEAATTEDAREFLQSSAIKIDLVVLDPQNINSSTEFTGWEFCQELKAAYPQLPILVLSTLVSGSLLLNSNIGIVNGYCPKGTDISLIIAAIRETAAGKSYWQQVAPLIPVGWRERWRQSGLEQIDTTLAEVQTKLQNRQLSLLDWLFWSGRQRELKTARWLVERVLPGDTFMKVELPGNVGQFDTGPFRKSTLPQITASNPYLTTSPLLPDATGEALEPIFEATKVKLALGVENQTSIPLEIDILKPHQKYLLLETILTKFQELVKQLRKSQLTLEQLETRSQEILEDLWQVSITDFFGKYYTLSVGESSYQVVDVLLTSLPAVRLSILNKIPFFSSFLSYLVAGESLEIAGIKYEFGSPTGWQKAEILLQNLTIHVANSTIQPLLNDFGDIEEIKTLFYQEKLLSNREIAKFRNELSWKYRREKYLDEPSAIFESRYWLFILKSGSIQTISIYAPRRDELEKLQGVRLTVTLFLELRDAIAPRARALVSFASKVAVYLLTQVIGKGLGLIFKGILQGVGNSLQESRWRRNSDR